MNILHRPAIKDMEMKPIVLMLVLFLAAYIVNAQSVLRVYGSDCTGATNIFVYNGSSCTSYNWYISSGGTIISGQGTASVQVKWNSPTSNAHVSVNYSCYAYPYSGTSYSSTYSISNPLTPSVSIASNHNNVCPGTNITFTASPANAGSNLYYNWRINGSTVSSGTSSTFARNNLNHGDVVSVVMSVKSSG